MKIPVLTEAEGARLREALDPLASEIFAKEVAQKIAAGKADAVLRRSEKETVQPEPK